MPDAGRARGPLRVDPVLAAFVTDELLPGTDVTPDRFWAVLTELVATFGPRHRELLAVRDRLQAAIDAWHGDHRGEPDDPAAHRRFLEGIGYLVPAGGPFTISTTGVDPEVATVAGPQLVVPATNPRYALNAANARWGSLYDALYGSDALGTLPPPGPYDPDRGREVVARVRQLLDVVAPLDGASHADVVAYSIRAGAAHATLADGAVVAVPGGVGHTGPEAEPTALLLEHHGLGVVLCIDREHPVGADDPAGVADVLLEAALTTIVDLEDSVATVDGTDKVEAYRTWLGLMRGDLVATIDDGGTTRRRTLAPDRRFTGPDGSEVVRRGRALLLVRTVGLHLTTPAVLAADGAEVPEGIVDALVTVTAALHDRARPPAERSSPSGSVYVVEPKLHGPDEVALTVALLAAVERHLGLPDGTVKLGLMDEERRTTLNLAECVRAARERVAFVNTGFLDRTADEIHTAMAAGPVVRKADMAGERWFRAYEQANVDVALACGFSGRAQIGKGMWARPDRMAEMLATKGDHPRAGATCAWVPSPTAATLHATHYHHVDALGRHRQLAGRPPVAPDDLLALPVADPATWDDAARRAEVDANVHGILGYVARWVDQGVGCSKIAGPDGVALMEDRATCRISSQHLASWLRHGVVDEEQVRDAFARMAAVVDRQNAADAAHRPLAPTLAGPAARAALALVLEGATQASGYVEPILCRWRAVRQDTDRSTS